MFRLLQRMDDSAPRHAEGGGRAPLRLLKPLTVLAEADEPIEQALEDWARGLDWVDWLFSSIRHRLDSLHCSRVDDVFSEQIHHLCGHLIRAWQAAEAGDAGMLQTLDQTLASGWPAALHENSVRAGHLLLRATRGARYQGALGRYRAACEQGCSPGHFMTVWAAVGHFFQLSVANVIAEYLRLELRMSGYSGGNGAMTANIAAMTSRVLQNAAAELQLLGDQRGPVASVVATPT